MKLPNRYLKINWNSNHFNLNIDKDGQPINWGRTYDYIPHGFLDARLFDIGNGDSTGFYWAIGRENDDPLLCDIYHDNWALAPVASNLEDLIKVNWYDYQHDFDGQISQIAVALDISLPDLSKDELSTEQRLEFNPKSPYYLVIASQKAIDGNDLKAAETNLQKAIKILPEYALAHYYLAMIYRRIPSRKLDAINSMIQTLICPITFGGVSLRRKVLYWLQSEDELNELQSNPLWVNRHKLTCYIGEKYNNDFGIYEEAIEEYLNQGQGVNAIQLRTLVRELMGIETTAFRERYKYTKEKHKELLIDNLKTAGLAVRIPSIR